MRQPDLRRLVNRPATRRRLVQGSMAGAAATIFAATPFGRGDSSARGSATLRFVPPTQDISGTKLRILQWSHFVPAYDAWFDEFAKDGAKPTASRSPSTTSTPPRSRPRSPPRSAPARATIWSSTSPRSRQYEKSDDRHDRRRRGGDRAATATQLAMCQAQLVQPDDRTSTTASATATPPTRPTTASRLWEAVEAAERPDDLRRNCSTAAPGSRASRASRWASGCRTRSTPAWPPRR